MATLPAVAVARCWVRLPTDLSSLSCRPSCLACSVLLAMPIPPSATLTSAGSASSLAGPRSLPAHSALFCAHLSASPYSPWAGGHNASLSMATGTPPRGATCQQVLLKQQEIRTPLLMATRPSPYLLVCPPHRRNIRRSPHHKARQPHRRRSTRGTLNAALNKKNVQLRILRLHVLFA